MKIILTLIILLFCLSTKAQTTSDTSAKAKWSDYRDPAKFNRKSTLIKKYGVKNGTLINNGEVKVGFTMKMVNEAIGSPSDIKEEVSGNKTKVTFVYNITSTRTEYYYFNGNKILTGWKK